MTSFDEKANTAVVGRAETDAIAISEEAFVFNVRPASSEIDLEAMWGLRLQIGFRAECGEWEYGTSANIGQLIRGHLRRHAQRRVHSVSAPRERGLAPISTGLRRAAPRDGVR
jgi:hypothetical protein